MEDKDIRLTNTSRDFLICLNSSHHVTTLSMRYKTRVAQVGRESPSFTSRGYMLWETQWTPSQQGESSLQPSVLTLVRTQK